MEESIVIAGYTLTATPSPSTVTVAMTPTNTPALRCTATGQSVLINSLKVSCACNGPVTGGTFSGTGVATILASTPRVTCEGQSILTQDDSATITVNGTITQGTSSSPGTVSVTVAITNAGQQRATANKA